MQKDNKKRQVVITCTKKQAYLIEVALDTLSRMVGGQMDIALDGMSTITHKPFYVKRREFEILAKSLLFPELEDNEYYGVGMEQIGDGQIMYEMVKKLQNFRANKDTDEHSVLRHPPLHYSDEPLIEVHKQE